jgi:hypothetical protein
MAGSTDAAAANVRQKEEDARQAHHTEHAAALTHAEGTEKEAAAASKECDDAAARARAALERAAHERKAAAHERKAAAAALNDAASDHTDEFVSVHGESPGNLHGTLLLHKAAALLNLHAQAVAVQNIRSLVLIVLDVNSGSYSKWREQFLLTLGKYSLQDQVLQDDPPRPSPDWVRMDCVILCWLNGTLSSNLVDIVMARRAQGATARST